MGDRQTEVIYSTIFEGRGDMILFDFEWSELTKTFGDFFARYQAFAPDVWWSEENGCYCTAVLDMTRSFEEGEIIEVFVIPKKDAKFMWE